MPPTRLNFARMFSDTAGTGDLQLAAVSGRPTFNQSLGVSSGVYPEFKYTILDSVTGAYEIGTGTYNATTLMLSNRTPVESWNGVGNVGTSLISFAPPVTVYCGIFHQDVITAEESVAVVDAVKVQGFSFTIEPVNGEETTIVQSWPIDVDCPITHIAVETKTGTVTLNFKIDGVSVTGASAVAGSTTEATVVPSGTNVLTQGSRLSVLPSSVVGATEVAISVRYERVI